MMTPRTLASLSGTTGAGRRPRRRRGVAMLLVLVALGVGTVLAAASLSSRDNSAAIGQNAQRSAAARWAAEGGMRMALAVLETTFDWSTVTQGRILDKFVIAGASVTVTATTPAGAVPTANDREMILTAVAEVDGISTSIRERVSLVTVQALEKSINPYLDEFAVFADTSMDIRDGASLTSWALSPEADTLIPIRLGTGFSAKNKLSIGASVKANNTVLFSDGTASSSLADATDKTSLATDNLFPISVPTMGEVLPSSIKAVPTSSAKLNVRAARTENTSGAFGAVTVRGKNGVLTLDGTSKAVFRFASLNIRNQGTLRIVGDVKLEIANALTVQTRGGIELADATSSLTIYTGGDVTVTNAAIGVPRTIARDTKRTINSVTAYSSPARLRLIAVNTADGGKAKPKYTLDKQCLALCAIHAPQADVELKGDASIIGRISAADFKMESGSTLAYDSTLDPRSGFSAKIGPLYEKDGTPVPEVLTATSACDPNLGSAWWSMTACNAVRTLLAADPTDDTLAVSVRTTGVTELVDGILTPVEGLLSGSYSSGSGSSGSGSSGSGTSGKGKKGKSSGSGYSSGSGSYGSTDSSSSGGPVTVMASTVLAKDGVSIRFPRKVVHAPICDASTGASNP